MSASAIVMMLAGVVIIWGGLGASIAYAAKKSKESKKQ